MLKQKDIMARLKKTAEEAYEQGPEKIETANSAMKKAVAIAALSRASNNARRFPKNNHFCYRWRVVDEFNKSIDRDMHNARLYGGDFHQSLINERVLATFKTSKLKFHQNFMEALTADAVDFLQTRKQKAVAESELETVYTRSMSAVLQGLFDIMLSCSIEFNTKLGFSELFIASMEPEIMTLVTPTKKTSSLRCRFSTSHFSLVLNGYKNEIKFFILPVEDLMGLSSFGYGREAALTLKAELTTEGVVWFTDDSLVTEDEAERVCLTTMKRLVDMTCEVLSHSTPAY